MIFAWLDESGDKNCYQEKAGQTPIYVLCSWFLASECIARVSSRLYDIESNYRTATNIRREIKGTDIIRPYKSNRKRPAYIHEANERFLHDIIQCLRDNEAKVVARAFAKRTHAKYDPQKLFSFAHLTL